MFFYKNLFFVYFIQFSRAIFVQFLHLSNSFILDIQSILRDYRHGGKIAAKPEAEEFSLQFTRHVTKALRCNGFVVGPIKITIILRMKIVYGIISV